MSATGRPDRVRVMRAAADRLLAALPDRSIDVVLTDPPYLTVNRRPASGHLQDWFANGLTWPEVGRVLVIARKKPNVARGEDPGAECVLLCVPALEGLPHDHQALIVRPNERPVGRDDAWTDVAHAGAHGFEHAEIDALCGGFLHRSARKRSRTARSISEFVQARQTGRSLLSTASVAPIVRTSWQQD